MAVLVLTELQLHIGNFTTGCLSYVTGITTQPLDTKLALLRVQWLTMHSHYVP